MKRKNEIRQMMNQIIATTQPVMIDPATEFFLRQKMNAMT
jgi:hypothetical protein